MRLLSLNHNGHAGYGALANEAGEDIILDLTGRLFYPTLKEALADLPAIRDARGVADSAVSGHAAHPGRAVGEDPHGGMARQSR